MTGKLIVVALTCACLAVAGCNTVRGAATDVNSVANCTEELMKQGRC